MADISITAANVLKSASGTPGSGTFGATITQGQVLYKKADGTYGLADSNGTTPANSFAGIALNAGASGQPASVVTLDPALNIGATLTAGAVIYLSDTPGAITATYADIASGSTVIILGVGNTDGTLNLNPIVGGVKP